MDQAPDRGERDTSLENEWTKKELWDAIAKLPKKQRTVVMMRIAQNLPYKDISEITGMSNITEEVAREAYFKMAKAYQALGEMDKALAIYRKVAVEVTSSEGAESMYRVAELLYKENKKDEAEKVILKFINMSTPHTYWMAKAFLLLSDISLDKDDLLQAKYTLKSLLDYYKVPDDGILQEAREKLKTIEQFEKLRNAPDSIEAAPDTLIHEPGGGVVPDTTGGQGKGETE